MPRVYYQLLLRDKVQFLLEQKHFKLQNYKAVVGSGGQRENSSFIRKICGQSGYYFSLKNTCRNWLGYSISSCKRLTSPPGERNEDLAMWKSLGPLLEMFLFMLFTQLLHLLTRGSTLCCPIIQPSLAAHSNEKLGYCRILYPGIQLGSYSLSWTCSHKCIHSEVLQGDV